MDRAMWPAELPVFDDALGDLPTDLLGLLGGRLYEVGYQDGVLTDLSRNRRIRYRVRYPKGFAGPAAVILISQGGLGDELGHLWYPHFGTAFARLGFLAVNIGHLPSADEMRHRYDRPLDVSFVIDALARVAAAARGTPYDAEEALPLPAAFTGVLDQDWLGHHRLLMPPPPPAFTAAPDVDHIGVLGHSFGAFTAHAVGGAEHGPTLGIRNFRDPRVDAIVPIAPQGKDRYGCFDKGPENNSWQGVAIPAYVLLGDDDLPDWRRRPFDRYPAVGDKFLTIGKDQSHAAIAGWRAPVEVRRLLDLNTALFFHTYLRGGEGRRRIGSLAWLDGWTLERRIDPTVP
jgi:hypothetical protein